MSSQESETLQSAILHSKAVARMTVVVPMIVQKDPPSLLYYKPLSMTDRRQSISR